MLTLTANNHFTAAAFLPQTVHAWVCLSTFLHLHFCPWNVLLFHASVCPTQFLLSSLLITFEFVFFSYRLIQFPTASTSCFSPISLRSLSLQNPLLSAHLKPPSAVGVSCRFWHVSWSPDVCVGCCWKLGHAVGETEREREAKEGGREEGKKKWRKWEQR